MGRLPSSKEKKKGCAALLGKGFGWEAIQFPSVSAIKGLLVPKMQVSSVLKIPLEHQENWRHSRSVCFCENKEGKNFFYIHIYIYIHNLC